MTRHRIGAPLALAMLLLLPTVGLAQNQAQPTFENPALSEARTLYRQAAILEMLKALEITAEQGQVILQVNAEVLAAQQGMNQALQALVGQNLQFMQAYVQGTLVDDPQTFEYPVIDQADALLGEIAAIRGEYEAICFQAYDAVFSVLSEAQLDAIETYEEQAFKADRANMALDQGGTSLDALVQRLLMVRDMEPDAYQQQAEGLATGLARRVVGDDPELLPPAIDAMIALMETVRAIPADAGDEALTEFREQVRQQLGLDAQGRSPHMRAQTDLVTQAGFENMLRDPVTSQVLSDLLGISLGGGGVQ